jgi:serine/threonine protein kinase
MTPERWQQIESAFHHATALPPGQLAAYLDTLDPDTRHEVQSLLDAENNPLTLTSEIVDTIEDLQKSDPRLNQRLGPYRILGELGSGGMGSVFKATRDDDAYQKTVAIKIIRANLAHTQLEQRFRAERQILAQLEHPYIARLIDGGTQDGLPYIVMEYIEGQPIDHYVRQRNLSTRDRLILFRKVCEAVQHAHQRLIVHRDLKPGNILVLPDGTPKLLDFGIAKLLDQETNSPDGPLTQTGWLLMTPDYASPEQVRGDAITVASDIYSLAVILYELLTGQRPYTLKNYSPSEIQQAICTGIIPPPKVSSDIDNMLLMALRLDPARRYPSVEKFSEDLRRYLEGEPVSARPDTFLYRSTKFIQRNRLAVALTTVLLLTVLTGAALVYREGLRSQRRFSQVRSIANRVLTEFDQEASKLPGNTKLRSIMVRASMEYLDSLAAESTSDPELQYEVAYAYSRVGDTLGYHRGPNLNQPFEAAIAFNKAISLAKAIGDQPKARHLLAYVYAHYAATVPRLGKPEQARAYFEKAMPLIHDADPITAFEVRHGYAHFLLIEGENDLAITILDPALAVPPASLHIGMNLNHLASDIEINRGNLARAITLINTGLALSNQAGRSTVGYERTAALLLTEKARLTFSRQHASLWQPCQALPIAREAAELFLKLANQDPNKSTSIQAIDSLQIYASTQANCQPDLPTTTYDDIINLYQRINLIPVSAHSTQALRLLRLGKPKDALALIEPHFKHPNQQLETLRIASEIYLALKLPAEAIAILEPAMKIILDPRNQKSFDAIHYRERSLSFAVLLCDAYRMANRNEDATSTWQSALTRVPAVCGKFPPAPSTLHWQRELKSRL